MSTVASDIRFTFPGSAPEGSKVRVGEHVKVVPCRGWTPDPEQDITGLVGPVAEIHRSTLDLAVELPGVGRRTLRQRQVEVVRAPAATAPDPMSDRALLASALREVLADLGMQVAMRWTPTGESDREEVKRTLARGRELLDALSSPSTLETPRPAAADAPTLVMPRRRPVVIEAMGCE